MTHRRLVESRDVLIAHADNEMHGPVTRELRLATAERAQWCVSCGLHIKVGDLIQRAHRRASGQYELWVHEKCPQDLYDRLGWLRAWSGADLVVAWVDLSYRQSCARCSRTYGSGASFALVRRPGPMTGGKHSDYICATCVRA